MFNLIPHIFLLLKQFILITIKSLIPKFYKKYNLKKYEFEQFQKRNTGKTKS